MNKDKKKVCIRSAYPSYDIFFFMLIALGGFLGAVLREIIMLWLPSHILWFPILLINILGSFTIGIIYGIEERLHPRMKDFYAIGFCGGFSTFSHFTYQTFNFLKNGFFIPALLNVFFSVLLTVLAVFAGLKLAGIFKIKYH